MSLAAAPTQAVVLVGGLGTRLGSLTGGLPKPMVDVGGRPFLSYLLWHAGRFGFRRVLLLAGHRAETIRDHAQALAPPGVEIEVVVEPSPLGTAGALRFAADRLDERVLLLNGDSLFDFNWLDLLGADDGTADVVLSLRREADASRFGAVEVEGERITGFRERGDQAGGLINGGVYVLRRGVAQACPPAGSFERDVLPALAAAGRVRGREAQGFFLDIGVPDALARARTEVPESLNRPCVVFGRGVVLGPGEDARSRGGVVRWAPRALDAVKAVNDAGWFAFLAADDGDPALRRRSEADLSGLYEQMQLELRPRGAHLDAVVFPDPDIDAGEGAVGLLTKLSVAWPLDVSRSVTIGIDPHDLDGALAPRRMTGQRADDDLAERVKFVLTRAGGGDTGDGGRA